MNKITYEMLRLILGIAFWILLGIRSHVKNIGQQIEINVKIEQNESLKDAEHLVDVLWQGPIQLGRRNVIELPDDTVLVIDDLTSPATDYHQVDSYEPKTRLLFEITHQKNATAVSTITPPTNTTTDKRPPRIILGNGQLSTNWPKNSVGYRWWAAIGPNKRNVIALTDDMEIDIARLVIDGSASPKNNQDQPNGPKEQLFLKITRRVANPTQKP